MTFLNCVPCIKCSRPADARRVQRRGTRHGAVGFPALDRDSISACELAQKGGAALLVAAGVILVSR